MICFCSFICNNAIFILFIKSADVSLRWQKIGFLKSCSSPSQFWRTEFCLQNSAFPVIFRITLLCPLSAILISICSCLNTKAELFYSPSGILVSIFCDVFDFHVNLSLWWAMCLLTACAQPMGIWYWTPVWYQDLATWIHFCGCFNPICPISTSNV